MLTPQVRDFMNEATAAKIHMHGGTNAKEIREALVAYLPSDVLFRAAVDIDLGSGPGSPGTRHGSGADAEDDGEAPLTDAEIVESGQEMLPRTSLT